MKKVIQRDSAKREKVDYHSGELPIYIRGADLSIYPTMCHPCHYHEDIEFLYAVKGHLTYFINGQLCRIGEGEGIFVNSRHLHYGFSEDGSNCEFFCILLNPVMLSVTPFLEREYLSPLMENTVFTHQLLTPQVPWQKRILELMRRAYAVYQKQELGYVLELQSCFYGIWQQLYCNMPRDGAAAAKSDPKLNMLRKMICYLQEHLTEKLTLSDIAAAGHMCESTCCRLFQKYLNRSPVGYLNECRLDKACELLRDSDTSITEVANQTGFNGASYFTEQFRKQYGCTPSQFRDRCRK